MRTFQPIWALLLCCWLISPLAQAQTAKKSYNSLQEALFSARNLSGSSGPASVNWIAGGQKFSYIQYDAASGKQEIRSLDPAKLTDALVFNGGGLTTPGTSEPFSYESFQWSADAQYLLFQTNLRPIWRYSGLSDYYYYSLANKQLKLVAQDAYTAELSPNGQMVGFEREGDLYAYDLAKGQEIRLTEDAEEQISNGRFGWVYEEEFGLVQGWKWSPNSQYMAYWQTNERQVPIFQMTDYDGHHPEYEYVPYPKVGDPNPEVRIGVVDVTTQQQQWLDLEVGDGYIPRIYWTSRPGVLAVVHLNRRQNHLTLWFFDVKTGKGQKIMEEKSDAWIDVFDFFAHILDYFFFPAGSEEFFWVSERDGWAHLYRYDYSGKLLNQVTSGDWEVTYLHHIDPKTKTVFYTSTEASPLERHLYKISFDGKKKTRLTQVEGTHEVNLSPNGEFYLDSYSNIKVPEQVELWNTKGKMLKKMEDNAGVTRFVSGQVYAPKELVNFRTSDGQLLDLYVIKPINFDPNKKYPLVLNIYGGPGAQSVYNSWGSNGWEQYLAQQGYVVASVNNRGSGGYGRAFEKIVNEQLGKWEANDFVEAARYLVTLGLVDSSRMAIRGHSYGGYMASYTMLTHPGVFKVALVGAPVTDWRLYDSIYAERYMGLMPQNEEKYVASAPTTYAGQLEGKMFIAHSTMDENVHVQNTFQLVKALIDRGKDADLRIYPPGAHGVAYDGVSYVLLYQQYTDYLNQHLK